MNLSRTLLLLLAISLAILGCRKDDIGFIPSEDREKISTVDLTGVIADPDGNPVVGGISTI